MIIPKYCGSNDPLLSYTTRLHPLEMHTTSRSLINSIPLDDKSQEKDIKIEIKTETKDIKTTDPGNVGSIVNHQPYRGKFSETKY